MLVRTEKKIRLGLLILLALPIFGQAAESVCHGSPANGRLEGGVLLPRSGKNFGPYSHVGIILGRTYVHSNVRKTVADAYASLAKSQPDKFYLYGESGFSTGGQFKPHRTHRNGLSVDFMVPVVNSKSRSVPLPTAASNKYGYAIEFNDTAVYKDYTIDFEAISEHLYALHAAAAKNQMGLSRVIFDPAFIPRLYATKRGKFIKDNIHFMPGKAWIRHDEHYHVDFSVPCRKP